MYRLAVNEGRAPEVPAFLNPHAAKGKPARECGEEVIVLRSKFLPAHGPEPRRKS